MVGVERTLRAAAPVPVTFQGFRSVQVASMLLRVLYRGRTLSEVNQDVASSH